VKFAAKCPECGNVLSILANSLTRKLICSGCGHRFIPLEDSGLACPKCGEITMMALRDIGPGVSCLGCGFVFRGKSIWRRWGGAVPISMGIAAFIVLIYFFAIYQSAASIRKVNEASAISALRTMSSAQELYNTRYGSYATSMAAIANSNMIDIVLANATTPQSAKSGYYFSLTTASGGWQCVAKPAQPGTTGARSFFIDETGVIYHAPCMSEDDPPASPNSKPLGIDY